MPRPVSPVVQVPTRRERSVLIVDDDGATAQVLESWFRDAGWTVTVAGSCAEAERAVVTEVPGLLLIEEKLRDGCGVDLFQGLRARNLALSGVVLTRHGSITGAVRAIRGGFRDYLVKPLDRRRFADLFGSGQTDTAPSLERVEWEHIHAVLGLCRGNISEAARRLGIHRRSLQRRLRRPSPPVTALEATAARAAASAV